VGSWLGLSGLHTEIAYRIPVSFGLRDISASWYIGVPGSNANRGSSTEGRRIGRGWRSQLMSQQRTSRAEFTRKAGTPGDLAATDEVPSAGTYPSSAARNTPDKRVDLKSTAEPNATCPECPLSKYRG